MAVGLDLKPTHPHPKGEGSILGLVLFEYR
jgi:hypothetical protein